MIAVDTNILVRYATNDEPIQSQQAKDLLKNAEAIFITSNPVRQVRREAILDNPS